MKGNNTFPPPESPVPLPPAWTLSTEPSVTLGGLLNHPLTHPYLHPKEIELAFCGPSLISCVTSGCSCPLAKPPFPPRCVFGKGGEVGHLTFKAPESSHRGEVVQPGNHRLVETPPSGPRFPAQGIFLLFSVRAEFVLSSCLRLI